MRRRDFLPLAAATGMAWISGLAGANDLRIGFVHAGFRQENQSLLDSFRNGLSGHGWTDGDNITILDRWAEESTERFPDTIKELISSDVAILVTAGTVATLAAKRAKATIPIVLVGVDDPVAIGVVFSLAQPRGNVTGLRLTSSDLIAQRFGLLRQLVPDLRRLAVILRESPGLEQNLYEIRSNAERMGIELLALSANTGKALEFAFRRLRAEPCDAAYVASGPLGPAKRATIISLAAEARLPVLYCFRAFPVDGGLISFSADYDDLFRRAAGFVDKILKGTSPANLPVEPPRKFDLTVNLKTAMALGLTIPPPILARADEVIE
jgi:putative ABC transport system substrate-binding protein